MSENSSTVEEIISDPYEQFMAKRNEILVYKWVKSEEEGRDIGFEAALLGWHASHAKPSEPPVPKRKPDFKTEKKIAEK